MLEQNPNYPSAQANLGATLYREGKIEEAEKLFTAVEKNSAETRKIYPRTWFGALNLAKLRHSAHDDQAALAVLHKTQRDYPNVWDLIGLEAEILREANRLDNALQLVETFMHENWWHYGAAIALGQLYAQKGDAFRAEAAFRHASRRRAVGRASVRDGGSAPARQPTRRARCRSAAFDRVNQAAPKRFPGSVACATARD